MHSQALFGVVLNSGKQGLGMWDVLQRMMATWRQDNTVIAHWKATLTALTQRALCLLYGPHGPAEGVGAVKIVM